MRILPKIHGTQRAFTLVELMMVMFVMALVTTIVATNAFGVSRSSSFTSAQDILFNALSLARQPACMNNHEVCVVFLDETTFVVVEGVGKAVRSGTSVTYDPYPQRLATNAVKGLTLWNLGTGEPIENAKLTKKTDIRRDVPGYSTRKIEFEAIEIGGGGNSLAGNTYGVETLGRQRIPKGFQISFNKKPSASSTPPDNDFVHFYADGSSDGVKIYAYEIIRPEDNYIEITVEKSGFVHVTKSASE